MQNVDVEESEEDNSPNAWLHPSDANYNGEGNSSLRLQRAMGILMAFVTASEIAAAIYCWVMYDILKDSPLLFWYMIATLTVDLCLWALFGSTLLFLGCFVGDVGMSHSAALCGILNTSVQGLMSYASVVVGTCLLVQRILRIRQIPWPAIGFIILEITTSGLFILRGCPVVWGIMGYGLQKLSRKIRREPLVEFQRPDTPLHYVTAFEMQDYKGSLLGMDNPTIASVRPSRKNEASWELEPLVEEAESVPVFSV